MEHSEPSRQRGLAAVLAGLDLVGHLTLPLSLVALTRGRVEAAAAGSVLATAIATIRAFAAGHAVERSMRRSWRRAVEAARRRPVAALRAHREQHEGSATLLEAVRERAVFDALVVPQLVAKAAALALLLVAVAVVLGPSWLLLGALAFAPIAAVVVASNARLRRAQRAAWEAFGELGLDLRVLLEASAELRAHEREEAHARALLARADAMAGAERVASRWSTIAGLLPACLALAAVIAPVRARVAWVVDALAGARLAEAGVLGAAAAVLALGLSRSIEAAVRSAPQRRAFDAFVAGAPAASRPSPPAGPLRSAADSRPSRGPLPSLVRAIVRLERVSFVHAGAGVATPSDVTFEWPPGRGLAVTGANGAGKTTLAWILLGLLEPTAGRVTLDGVALGELDGAELRRRVAYVPQAAFVAPGCSVAWHLALLAGPAADAASIDAALARVGLLPVLERHAARTGIPARDVPAGELSGGERARMQIARALLGDAELVLLDEPEAGLDAEGRALVRGLLDELSRTKRVLVIAHDDAIVPGSFARLVCVGGKSGPHDPGRIRRLPVSEERAPGE